MAHAGAPERVVTLTIRPLPSHTIPQRIDYLRGRLRVLCQRIRRQFKAFQYLACLELTKRGTPHIHMLTRGTYISQRWLSSAWLALTGAHQVHISKIDRKAGAIHECVKYLIKTAGAIQAQCPNIPIVTCSRGWLPESWHKKMDPPDPYAFFFRVAAPFSDLSEALKLAGMRLTTSRTQPNCYSLEAARAPPVPTHSAQFDRFRVDVLDALTLIRYACNPTQRDVGTFADALERAELWRAAMRWDDLHNPNPHPQSTSGTSGSGDPPLSHTIGATRADLAPCAREQRRLFASALPAYIPLR